jgi:hypothetical protein
MLRGSDRLKHDADEILPRAKQNPFPSTGNNYRPTINTKERSEHIKKVLFYFKGIQPSPLPSRLEHLLL